jgi:CRISPR-associated protein Cas5h
MEAGLVINVSFDLAHFRVHTTMKSRSSYLLPLPTTVIGFFFSILGKNRQDYIQKRKYFRAGAQIIDIKGICCENAQLLKLKSGRELRTTEQLTILLKPKYKFAVWGDQRTLNHLHERIENFEYEFVPYGGISDFIFTEIEKPVFSKQFCELNVLSNSYVPRTILDSVMLKEGSLVYSLPYAYSGKREFVVMGLDVTFKLKEKVRILDGVPLYNCFLDDL